MKAISINPLCSDSVSPQAKSFKRTKLFRQTKVSLLKLASRVRRLAFNRQEQAIIQPVVWVTNGIHEGAKAEMLKNSMFLVGRALDCDLILNDADIAPHHCLVSFIHGSFQVRALEGALQVKNKEMSTGNQCLLAPGSTVNLGGVSLRLVTGQESVSVAKSLAAWIQRQVMYLLNLSKVRPLFVLAMVAGFVTLSFALFNNGPAKATAGFDANKLPPTSAGIADVNPNGLPADSGYLNGVKDLAKEVAEIMRLSGIPVQAENMDEGIVAVKGYFGQPGKVDKIIQSRAISDIKGLQKIKLINLSSEAPTIQSTHISITRIIGGEDPYVVTSDGAIYYPGATLSSGFEVAGINKLLVRLQHADGTVQHLKVGQKFE